MIFIFQPKKGVFSGFGGFNKTQTSSFDFLANLTNGSTTNSSPKSKSDTTVTSSLFSSKPPTNSPNVGLFGPQVSSTPAAKSPFSASVSQPSLFGGSTTNTQTVTSLFTASKADSTVGDSPFKTQPISSSNDVSGSQSVKTTIVTSNSSGSQVTSTIFGAPTASSNVTKSLFSNTNTTPFNIQPVSSSTTVQSHFGTTTTVAKSKSNESMDKKETQNDENKMKYYSKLKGLNESVSDWIKKHVEETPLCILTPIFRDYEKYLKEMQDEYQGSDDNDKTPVKGVNSSSNTSENKLNPGSDSGFKSTTPFGSNSFTASPFNKTDTSPSSKPTTFVSPNNGTSIGDKSKFSFGMKSTTSSTTTTTSSGFSFGVSTSQTTTTTTTSPFAASPSLSSGTSAFSPTSSLNSGTGINANGQAPFSFGIGKPFSFNSNIQKPSTEKTDNAKEDEDEPPKVEFTPVVEENSIYDKKCKIFVKKDGNFVDKGVGTLYIKKVEDSGKHQLLVRANTNLGNVLVNLILASAIPTQRMGKNNVMMVCIPTPDAKPPPTPILIRVKTSEEADELLETLNKYKT